MKSSENKDSEVIEGGEFENYADFENIYLPKDQNM
jgi:hypothetical protein